MTSREHSEENIKVAKPEDCHDEVQEITQRLGLRSCELANSLISKYSYGHIKEV